MGNIYKPLDFFRDHLRDEHATNTSAFFEELVARSQVDIEANAATVTKIRSLEGECAVAQSAASRWLGLYVLNNVVLVIGVFLCADFLLSPIWLEGAVSGRNTLLLKVAGVNLTPPLFGLCACVSIASLLLAFVLKKNLGHSEQQLASAKGRLSEQLDEAWGQLKPLNRLYEWSTIAEIVTRTVPGFVLDPFFSRARLDELEQEFDWDDRHGQDADQSTIFCQSGAINGNPVFLADTRNLEYVDETYYGSLSISWEETESYTDSNGNEESRLVARTETLSASLTAPAPSYSRNPFIVYGNEAAPNLNFTRVSNRISGDDRGIFGGSKLKGAVSALQKKTRKLEGFTIMANHEFDALFNAIDRDNEVDFRLMFTPFAQQEMVRLLRDKEVGFGDNFSFVKSGRINLIYPDHLRGVDVTADPDIYRHYDFATARDAFNNYSNQYFHSLYFALAPLLTIPIYQQHRSHQDVYKSVYANSASVWEYESIANYHGYEKFEHPDSITKSILKIDSSQSGDGDSVDVNVTAHGFRGVDRTTYVEVYGGDGNLHSVPVDWVEYIPVSRTSPLVCKEANGVKNADFEQQVSASSEWRGLFKNWDLESTDECSLRRSIFSFIPSQK